MIFPQPEQNLSLSILVLASEIIAKHTTLVSVDEALMAFLKEDKNRTPELFLDTLTFLYTLGILELHEHKIQILKRDYTQKTLF